MKITKDIQKQLDVLGIIFLTTRCIEHDIKQLKKEDSKFNSIEEILDFYTFAKKEYIYKKYIKTYGLL